MTFKRADRVAEQIMTEIAAIISAEVKDPRVHAMTVTAVKVSDDLRNAKIYFVEMGKDECSEETRIGLDKATSFVRRELGRRLQLRFVPEIIFIHDKSFGYSNRIEKLLANIASEEKKTEAEE